MASTHRYTLANGFTTAHLGGYVNWNFLFCSSLVVLRDTHLIGGFGRCHADASSSPQRTAEPFQLKVQLGLPTIRNIFNLLLLPRGGLNLRPPSSCILRCLEHYLRGLIPQASINLSRVLLPFSHALSSVPSPRLHHAFPPARSCHPVDSYEPGLHWVQLILVNLSSDPLLIC